MVSGIEPKSTSRWCRRGSLRSRGRRLVIDESTLRAFGPHTPIVHGLDVVGEGDRSVLGKILAEPVLVSGPIERSGDDPEVIFTEPKNGEVGAETAMIVEQRRVDRRSRPVVDLVDDHVLDVVERPRAR